MKRFFSILFLAVALLSLASATSNYEYGSDEYVTIAKGISPDGNFAVTAHGEGEYGYEHFHLYLTDAQTGRNIGALEEIAKILDTSAGAYVAKWSKDSSSVTIIWRWSRHDPFLSITYRIEGRRAIPLTKAHVDVMGDELGKYWSENCSASQPSARVFGARKKYE
ncbi:MAG: hypothetical protein EOP84_10395 [Verrucomicrobiaceae bacterium]|nr:MAG: hypothetical protein EOP84_10395 [Verrucomicrobiaceae bacterium]